MEEIISAIENAFVSSAEQDKNREPANVVDGLFAIARSIFQLAEEIKRGK